MAWQLEPPESVKEELGKVGQFELKDLMSEVQKWIEEGTWDDLALARGIAERGHSEEFSYWLLKEVRMRDIDEKRRASSAEGGG